MPFDIDKLTTLPPVEIGYRLDPALPVITLTLQVQQAGCAASHAHPRGQFLHAGHGIMRVVCGGDTWVVPPTQAVWLPAMVEHAVYFPGEVTLYSLFVDPAYLAPLPQVCTVLKVSALLSALVARTASMGERYPPDGRAFRLMEVVLDEIAVAEPMALHLPCAQDPRLQRVLDALMRTPGRHHQLAALAGLAHTSSRTLARLFVKETGLTFGEWNQRLILQLALTRLQAGSSVTAVALDLGYRSVSAFIDMFRQALGGTPGQYFRAAAEP